MKNGFRKIFCYFLIVTFILTSGFPTYVLAQEPPNTQVMTDESVTDVPNPIAIEENSVQEFVYPQLEPVNPVIPRSTFGPYIGIDENKKHAYEPFKEKNEASEIKSASYKKDNVLIKLKALSSEDNGFRAPANSSLASSPLSSDLVVKLEPLFPISEQSKRMLGFQSANDSSDNLSKWYKATLKDGTDVIEAVNSLQNEPGVIAVEPDYLRSVSDLGIPNITTDPQIGEQWYLEQSQTVQAWTYLEDQGINPGGSRDVVVAVIDTGVDYNNPELAGNMWVNTAETRGNGIDDDGNGFVDDIYGACTVGNSYSGESGDPMDDHGHGTHVAGIIAAQANNGIGGVGVAYNVQIMAIKAAQSSGVLASSDIAQAIYYAAEKGADVINMSFGGYGRSTVEEDALQVAFGTSVLVAAAGNDGIHNDPNVIINGVPGRPMYPAAYNWVLGVMAESPSPAANGDNLAGFSNWDCNPQDSYEYEVMAPGVDIYSTLPNGKYAKWDGTSMSTPIVSGIAALLRSQFSDKAMYSSRFIMGQIASTGNIKQGKTYSPYKPPIKYREVNAYSALTNTPEPKLSYIEHYIFDTNNIAPENDGDGVVDAGETIDLAMVIRNHWGKADNVQVKLDTVGSGGMADPYVQLITDAVDYGAVGNFAIDDNGLIYENDVVTGVNYPFTFKVADNTPNDHVVPLNITLTCTNGFDPSDSTVYSFSRQISFVVRNGVELPGVISQDMTLTKDKYWIVPNATLIEKGATVTVEPGTQIQFWSSEPEDPYAEKPMAYIEVRGDFLVNGTAEEPVEMFASALYPGYEVKVYSTDYLGYYGDAPENYQGYAEFNYAKVMNPNVAVNNIDHCYFSQDLFDRIYKRYLEQGQVSTIDYYGPIVFGQEISNSKFYQLGNNANNEYQMLRIRGFSKGNLFDSCIYYMDEQQAEDNVYLKNYKLYKSQYGDRSYWVSKGKNFGFRSLRESVSGITLDKQSLILGVGDATATLIPIITPYNATNQTVSWSSSNTDVAIVNQNGVVAPVAIGEAIITATTAEGGYTANCNVVVTERVPATGLKLDKTELTLQVGKEETLTAAVLPAEATNKNVTWSSKNKSVATVDKNGKVTAIAGGTAVINATAEDGGYTADCTVNVEVPVNGISLDKSFLRLVTGDAPTTLTAIIDPSNATIQDVTWSSSNTAVVTVDENGAVTPVAEGTALITATTVGGGYTATCTVTVWDHAVSFVTSSIAAGYCHSAAINKDGTLWTWGYNNYGQLGDGTTVNRATPVQVLNLTDVTDVAAGYGHTVAVKSDGTVWAWGYNGSGQLGGSSYNNYSPIQVNNITDVVAVSAGEQHTVALKNDGTVWTWGNNSYGQLGDGTTTNRSTPVQVQNLTGVVTVAAGGIHTVAVKNDGTVWTWGYNSNGQLGDGTSVNRSIPIQVPNLEDITAITAGQYNTLAAKNDGNVYAWGNGYQNSPQRLQDLSEITKISAGCCHYAALKKDGTVWTWGNNGKGQLGDGTTNNRYTPVQVPGMDNGASIAAGSNYEGHTLAVKDDGTIWAWGYNGYGQLGDLTTENRLRPVQTLFGILPDTVPPEALSSTPERDASGVPTDCPITITFNEGIRPCDNFGMISLKDQSGATLSLGNKVATGTTLSLEPLNELKHDTTYTVIIPAGAVADMFNNGLVNDYTFSFTTNTDSSAAASLSLNKIAAISVQNISNNGDLSTIKNNAILNRWWDPNVEHWMRFTSEEGEQYVRYLSNNYWGTTSETLIEKALIHFNDFRNMEEIIYKPFLTNPPETAYPFVTDVYVSTQTEERATKVGAETVATHVYFNRDMDTNIQPQVSFGPDMPTTDYIVNAVNGGWASPRHWVGEAKITPLTGDGYQFFHVAGAVATDDPWLVTGNDSERFRFEIVTSGTESMNLQASGGEGQIKLSWGQDDFDLLAGYNLYRSDAADGTYNKINNTVIPADQRTYEDTNVQPGKAYYYKFKVVKTDLTESDYSNVASAAAYDTVPPVINHEPVQGTAVSLTLQIFADVTDNVKVAKVDLYYRQSGSTQYNKKDMIKTTENRYSATIEGSLVQAPGIEYYIEATDGMSIVRNGRADQPNVVVITDAPKITSVSPAEGPETGGTTVIITGTNFKVGASVTFDRAVATGVTVENANRITAISPSNIPATVDVTVTNPDGYKDTLLRAYTYKSEGVEVSIPVVKANTGQTFEVPIVISSVTGLRSADLTITYDQDVLAAKSVRLGNITQNFSLVSRTDTPGQVILCMASATTVAGSGTLAYIEFEVRENQKTTSSLTLQAADLNAGSISVNKVNGSFSVAATYNINGTVNYFSNSCPLGNVNLLLKGKKNYSSSTDQNGNYSITNIEAGPYTLTASKANEATSISSYDASLILQASAGLINLSQNQAIAADVDNSGSVNAMDAAYVLEKAVDLRTPPFPGVGKVWSFIPAEKNYTNLNGDYNNENFTAILIGDVSGNWGNTVTASLQSMNDSSFTLGTVSMLPATNIYVPLKINAANEAVYSADLEIYYDENVAKPLSVNKSDLASNFNISANLDIPGVIKIAMAGAEPILGSGNLLNIKFEALGNANTETDLVINKAQVNESTTFSVINGKLIVSSGQNQYLTVIDSNPGDGAKGVAVDKSINIIFSENVLAGDNINGIIIKLGASMVDFTYSISDNMITIDPVDNLDPGQSYELILPKDSVKNQSSSTLNNDYKLSFSTSYAEGCFIATAAYGSYLDPHVMVLRGFRDNILLKHSLGKWFVAQYYHYSPPLAAIISQHASLRVATIIALTPMVYAFEYPGISTTFVFIGMVLIAWRRFRGSLL